MATLAACPLPVSPTRQISCPSRRREALFLDGHVFSAHEEDQRAVPLPPSSPVIGASHPVRHWGASTPQTSRSPRAQWCWSPQWSCRRRASATPCGTNSTFSTAFVSETHIIDFGAASCIRGRRRLAPLQYVSLACDSRWSPHDQLSPNWRPWRRPDSQSEKRYAHIDFAPLIL